MDADNRDGIRLPSQLMPYDEGNGSYTDSENDLNSVAAAAMAAISDLNPDDQRIADIKSRCENIGNVIRRLDVADFVASEDLQVQVFQQVFSESWAFFVNSSSIAFQMCQNEIWTALGKMVQFCTVPEICRIRIAMLFMSHLMQTLHSNVLLSIYQSDSLGVSEFFCRQLVDHGYAKFFHMVWEASAGIQKLELAVFHELLVNTVNVLTVITPHSQFFIRVGDETGRDAQLSDLSKEGNISVQNLWRALPDLLKNCLNRLPETALRQDFLQSTLTAINEHLFKKCSHIDRFVLLSVTSMRSNLLSFLIAHSPVLETRVNALLIELKYLELSRNPIELRVLLNSLQNIVQDIYSEGMHIELIRRSVGVMVLLSTNRKLSVDLLNCIWSAANERHESEQRVILDVLCELMENRTATLDRDLVIAFWSQIRSSFATVTITDRHFRLLVAMSKLVTQDAVRQNEQFEPMALDFFVDKLAIEADSIEFFKLFDMFHSAFNSVVNLHNILPFMDWMCGKLANVCKSSESSEKLTFKCWMFSYIWSSAIGTIQARLFEDFHFLDFLTRQLFPVELPPATQARHLQLRLHYLTNLCLHRPACFTAQNFESMWNLVFAADPAVSSEFCEFICRSISIFDVSVQTCIRLKISKIPQVSLTIPLFRCVVALARTSEGTRMPLKWLLGVLFHCTDRRTVAHARQYFQNLLVRLCVHSHNPQTVPALFEFAVKLCIQRIKRLSAATKINRQQQRHKLRAAFAALQILVSDRTPGKRSLPHASVTRSSQQIIFQFVNGAGLWQHQALDFPISALCGDIVGTAARLVNRNFSSVVLTIDGVILKRSLSMLPVTYFPHEARCVITVSPLVNDASQPIVLDEDADMTTSPRASPAPVSLPDLSYSAACAVEHPSTILSRDRYFAVLFDLLSTRSKQKQCKLVAKLAWQIVLKLPTSQRLLSQFASQSLDWSKYLSPKEYFNVQYSIQILDSVLKQLEADIPRKLQWITTFAENGGLKHLNRTIRLLVPLALKGQSKLPYLDLFEQVLCIFDLMIRSSVVQESPDISIQVYSIANVRSWLHACLLATKLSNTSSYQTCNSSSQTKLYALRQSVRYILNAVIVACALNPDGLDEFHAVLKDTKTKSSQSETEFSDWLATILLTDADSNGVSELVSDALLEFIRTRMQLATTQSAFEQAYQLLCLVLPRIPQAQNSRSPQVFLKFVTQLVDFVGSAGLVKLETRFSPDSNGEIEAVIDPASNVEISTSTLVNLTAILVNWLLGNKNAHAVDSFDFFASDMLEQQCLVEKSFDGIQNQMLLYVLRITSSLVLCLYCSHSRFANSVPVWSPSELLSVLYTQYLFDLPQQLRLRDKCDSPRCKSSTTREAAFALITSLSACFPAANLRLLDMMSQEASAPVAEHTSYAMVSNSEVRTSHSYVGLINQGATCYMNSLMQQLFMTPEFRYRLLGCQGELATGETSDQKQTLHQMQVMFSNLQESLRCELVTTAFTRSFKDYDGNPMNPSVQMDVDEFFNVLFDKLDNALMGTPHAGMPENVFGGRIVNQLVGKDCKHVKEREEKFLTLSLDIKNKRTLLEALSLYVQGEWLDGDNKYLCGQCNKKVDTLKRVCVKSLPRHLILHLKRFEFNLETMRKYKVNDYCEFPMELDMEPYTAEGIARREASSPSAAEPAVAAAAGSSCRYKLRGVLVHTGTSDSGHYYSFIRERLPAGQNERVWYQFNDDAVTEFPEADLPDACFGGKQALLNSDPKLKQHQIDKVNNAYMLFYDRIDDELNGDAASSDRVMTLMPTETADQVVQPALLDTVSRDNAQFVRNFVEFEPCRLKFVWNQLLFMAIMHRDSLDPLVNRIDFKHPLLCTIRVAIQFLDHTFAHANSKISILPTWSVDIVNRLAAHPLAALYFLHSLSMHDSCLEKLMMRMLPVKARELTVSMLARLLKFCSEHQKSTFVVSAAAEPVEAKSIENQASESEVQLNYQSVLSVFMSAIRNLLRLVTCKMVDPLATLILHLAKLGCVERRIMVESGLFDDVVFAIVGRKAFKLSNRKDEDLSRLLPLVHAVHLVMTDVTADITPLFPAELFWLEGEAPERTADHVKDVSELKLSEQVSRVLHRLPPTTKTKKADLAQQAFEPNELVFVEILIDDFSIDSPGIVGELLARLSHDDQALYRQVCRLICTDIMSVESPGFFTLIEILLRVELRSQEFRCRRMFDFLVASFVCKKVNPKQVGHVMKFLELMIQRVPIVSEVLWGNLNQLVKLLYEPVVISNVRLLVQRLITQVLAHMHDEQITVEESGGESQSFSVFDLLLNHMPPALRCTASIVSYLQTLDFFCTNDDHRALIGDSYMSEICGLLPVIGKHENNAAEFEQRAVFAFVTNLLKCGSNFDVVATSEAMFVQIMNSRVYGVDSTHAGFGRTVYVIKELCTFVNDVCRHVPERIHSLALCTEWLWAVVCFFHQYPALLQTMEPAFATIFRSPAFRSKCLNPYCTFIASNIPQLERSYLQLSSGLYALHCMIAGSSEPILDEALMSESIMKALLRTVSQDLFTAPRFASQIHAVERLLDLLEYIVDNHKIGFELVVPVDVLARACCSHEPDWRPVTVRFIQIQLNAMVIYPHLALDRIYCVGDYLSPALPLLLNLAMEALLLQTMSSDYFRLVLTLISEDLQSDKYLLQQTNGPSALFIWAMACTLCQDAELSSQSRQVCDQIVVALTTAGFQSPAMHVDEAPEFEQLRTLILLFSAPSDVATSESQHF